MIEDSLPFMSRAYFPQARIASGMPFHSNSVIDASALPPQTARPDISERLATLQRAPTQFSTQASGNSRVVNINGDQHIHNTYQGFDPAERTSLLQIIQWQERRMAELEAQTSFCQCLRIRNSAPDRPDFRPPSQDPSQGQYMLLSTQTIQTCPRAASRDEVLAGESDALIITGLPKPILYGFRTTTFFNATIGTVPYPFPSQPPCRVFLREMCQLRAGRGRVLLSKLEARQD
ncbi:hypothetical protein FIBSPDRAFT_902810 [Athelia psychrophila]|uniref:Uncharacterized protein n=1 Tax=Athelia psychrophila TaxID=1759441 RepID=A0A167WSB8_9AGAM|nr:hypothetical protein FIBSPDRAFT_902810 [Fibularhizoctonia sp. CBS 109695]